MANRIQLRRDTAANWASVNPVLAQGEVGIVTDAIPIQIKVGDGVTAWNSLSYVATGNMDVEGSTLDDLVDGTTYKRIQAAKADAINAGTYSEDDLADGTSYKRVTAAEKVHLAVIEGATGATTSEKISTLVEKHIIVAASDSIHSAGAKYICTGVNDEVIINAALAELGSLGGTVELLEGNFILNMPIYPSDNARIAGNGQGTILTVANKVSSALSSDAVATEYTIACNTAGFKAGMDITIFDDLHTGYNLGESNQIVSIDAGSPGTLHLGSPLKYSYATAQNAIVFSAYNAIDCYGKENVIVENLTIDGNKANQLKGNYDEWQNGVYLVNSHNSVVRNCFIKNCMEAGVMISHVIDGDYDGCEYLQITNNHIWDCGRNAIHAHGMKKSVISNNIVEGGGQSGIYLIYSDNNILSGNLINSTTNDGVIIFACKGVSIHGGVIKDAGGYGINIWNVSDTKCKDITVSGVCIIDSVNNGISMSTSTHCNIMGCTIDASAEVGISVRNCDHVNISGNTLYEPGSTAILVYNSLVGFNTIIGNIIQRTSYGYAVSITDPNCILIANVVHNSHADKISVTGAGSINEHNIVI